VASSGVDPARSPWGDRLRALAARPAVWVFLAVAVAALDYLSGPYVHLGLFYLLPIVLAAWFGHFRLALAIALVLPAVRLSYFIFDVWEPPGRFAQVAVNAAVRAGVLALVAVLVHRARRAHELERELTMLRGLLPICMYCKRIQGADDRWYPVEQYIGARSEAAFTHRVCPFCSNTHRQVFLGSGSTGTPGSPTA
jgi:hypothetical protein